LKHVTAFISSRTGELILERVEVASILESLDIDSFLFERDAGARTESIKRVYKEEVSASDIYIGIFKQEYSKPTEEEYWLAKDKGKEILIYVSKLGGEKPDPKLENLLQLIKKRAYYTNIL
jgi:hypothetical protein